MIRGEKSYLCIFFLLLTSVFSDVFSGGISVDAGLTPGQNRWIVRSQYRFMEMHNSQMTTHTHMVPLVVAYGISPYFTVMSRVMYLNRTIRMNESIHNNGFSDLFVLTKFKAYRKNTASFILGIAPYLATNIPIGNSKISERVWNPELGVSLSFRPRFWSLDVTSSYVFSNIFPKMEEKSADIFSLNAALSVMIPLKERSDLALSPVLEFTYQHWLNKQGSLMVDDQQVQFLAFGMQTIFSSLIIEGLYQYPFFQKVEGMQMKSSSRFILGLRYMF